MTNDRSITTVLFDIGDTLWHFPQMPPVDTIRQETMRRIRETVEGWGFDMDGERFYLGRDIRLAVEEETERAFHGDCVDPGYPELCRRAAARHGLDLTPEQGAELWEAWNLGGRFLGRVLFPDVLETLRWLRRRGYRLAAVTNRGYSGPRFHDEMRELELAPEQGEELWEAWNLGGAFLGRVLFPDVLDTLRWLRDRGYRLGAVTNRGYSGPRFHEEMRELGLADLFQVTVISCDIGYMKPHPRIFQYTLENMDVEAEETVMVGDNLRADVEGAKTLGMLTVWRRPVLGEPVEATETEPELTGPLVPDYAINDIGELKSLPLFADLRPAK